jgi:hypothetical protein
MPFKTRYKHFTNLTLLQKNIKKRSIKFREVQQPLAAPPEAYRMLKIIHQASVLKFLSGALPRRGPEAQARVINLPRVASQISTEGTGPAALNYKNVNASCALNMSFPRRNNGFCVGRTTRWLTVI